ncbi:MAG: hypothetical protein Q4C47_00985, partial [Planctomycetia bacterium]|nr:hypothetical protein [Planctomycetia bacterium]
MKNLRLTGFCVKYSDQIVPERMVCQSVSAQKRKRGPIHGELSVVPETTIATVEKTSFPTRLDLDENDRPTVPHNPVDLAVRSPEIPVQNAPSPSSEVAFRDSLALLTESRAEHAAPPVKKDG